MNGSIVELAELSSAHGAHAEDRWLDQCDARLRQAAMDRADRRDAAEREAGAR